MTALIKKEWNGFEIQFEEVNGQLMANATAMCAAYGKVANKWLRLKGTKELIAELESTDATLCYRLIDTRNTGKAGEGTWIHESLILDLAGWLNVKFKVQCQKWVAELLRTGSVSIKPKTQAEQMLAYAQFSVDLEKRQLLLETEVEEVKETIEVVKDEMNLLTHNYHNALHPVDYFTIAGYYALNKKMCPDKTVLQQYGKKVTALSLSMNLPKQFQKNSQFGTIGVYHINVLKKLLGF